MRQFWIDISVPSPSPYDTVYEKDRNGARIKIGVNNEGKPVYKQTQKRYYTEYDYEIYDRWKFENMDINTKENCDKTYEIFDNKIKKHNQSIIFLTIKQWEVIIALKEVCKREDCLSFYFTFLEKYNLSETNANLKIRLAELVKIPSKLKYTNLSLNIFNKYMKQIRLICEKSGQEYQ